MSKRTINFIVDTLALIAFIFLVSTGLLIRYILPPGTGHSHMVWEMTRHQWGDIHFWISITLIVLMLLHIILHWNWIICTSMGRPRPVFGIRLISVLVILLAILALAASPFLFKIVETGHQSPHRMQTEETPHDAHGHGQTMINGSMTLADIEAQTGVSTEILLQELNLPADTPTDERLGRLRREHDFEMQQIRTIVEKQTNKE